MNKRTFKILGWTGAIVLLLVIGALVGGGAVYALTQSQTEGPVDEQTNSEPGLVIASVVADSPAAQAGVKRGDILLKVDGQATDQAGQLISLLRSQAVGDQVELTVLHGDEEHTLTATLGDRNGAPYLGVVPCGGSPHLMIARSMARGATIVNVAPNSPAEQAGLQKGDVITAVDGEELTFGRQLAELITSRAPGETVTLTIETPNQEAREVTITLDEQPDQPGTARLGVQFRPFPNIAVFRGERFGPGGPGLEGHVLPLPDNIKRGAFIRQIQEGSPAAAADLNERDIITAINGEPINSPKDLVEAVTERQPGDTLTLTVATPDEEGSREVTVTLGENPTEPGQAYLGVQLGGFFRIQQNDTEGSIDQDLDLFIDPEAMLDDLPFDLELEGAPFHFFEFDGAPFDHQFEEFEFNWCSEGGPCLDNSI